MLTTEELIGLQRAEFAVASRLRTWQLALQFTLAIPAAVSVFVEGQGKSTYYLALIGVVILIAWIAVDFFARRHRDAAEAGRRATLIQDGLGHAFSPALQLHLSSQFLVSKERAREHQLEGYFASPEARGAPRLAALIEESAFWSEDLLRACGFAMTFACGALILLGVAALAIALPNAAGDGLLIVARMFLVMLVFALSSDVYGSAVGYLDGARKVGGVRSRLLDAAGRGYPLGDVLLAAFDYNSAVEAAPQTIPFIYRLRAKTLDLRWHDFEATRTRKTS